MSKQIHKRAAHSLVERARCTYTNAMVWLFLAAIEHAFSYDIRIMFRVCVCDCVRTPFMNVILFGRKCQRLLSTTTTTATATVTVIACVRAHIVPFGLLAHYRPSTIPQEQYDAELNITHSTAKLET